MIKERFKIERQKNQILKIALDKHMEEAKQMATRTVVEGSLNFFYEHLTLTDPDEIIDFMQKAARHHRAEVDTYAGKNDKLSYAHRTTWWTLRNVVVDYQRGLKEQGLK